MGIFTAFLTRLHFRRDKKQEDEQAGITTTTNVPTEPDTNDSEMIPFIADGEILCVLPQSVADGNVTPCADIAFDITPTDDISVTLLLKTLDTQYGLFGDDKRPNCTNFVSVDERYLATGQTSDKKTYIITHPAGGWEVGEHEFVVRLTDFSHSAALIEEKTITFRVSEE